MSCLIPVNLTFFSNFGEHFQNFEKVRISTILFMKKGGLNLTFMQCLGKMSNLRKCDYFDVFSMFFNLAQMTVLRVILTGSRPIWNRLVDLETGSRTLKQVLGPWNRFSDLESGSRLTVSCCQSTPSIHQACSRPIWNRLVDLETGSLTCLVWFLVDLLTSYVSFAT